VTTHRPYTWTTIMDTAMREGFWSARIERSEQAWLARF
jgi:hypothetical protein